MVEPPYGHESSGIAVRRLLGIGAVLALAVVLIVIMIHVALGRWVVPQHEQVVARRAVIPPLPRLQPHPGNDLATLRAQKKALLSDWAWTDQQHRFARIPIERAMTLYEREHASTGESRTPTAQLGADASGSTTQAPDPVRVPPPPAAPPPAAAQPLRSTGVVQLVPALPTRLRTTLRAPAGLLNEVGIDQHLGAQLPLDLPFRDTHGTLTPLRNLVGGQPTLLVPGYYDCVNLCGAVRAGVAHAIERSGLIAGKQFNVILISIDPAESPADADTAQRNDAAAHPGAQVSRWHYLTGTPGATATVMQAAGFRYLFDPRNRQYDHAAGIVLLSPQGRITQYLFGVQFAPATLRLGLVAASHGSIGNLIDRLVLLCCDYDPSTGRYSLLIDRVMQGLGIGTALTLGGLIVLLRRRELRRHDGWKSA